jgi:hypothetical protein
VVNEQRFYIRGRVDMTTLAHPPLVPWSAWAEITAGRFAWYEDYLNSDGAGEYLAFPAVLSTQLPAYPATIGLPVTVRPGHGERYPLLTLPSASWLLLNEE